MQLAAITTSIENHYNKKNNIKLNQQLASKGARVSAQLTVGKRLL